MKGVLILLLSLIIITSALADEEGVQKYRNFIPKQIMDLREKQIKSDIPIMYTFAAQRGLSAGSVLLFGMELNSLMYPGLHDYDVAVKMFQADLNDETTGILTVWQIHNLQKRAEMQKLSKVFFPNQFSSFKADDYASIEGTLIIVDEKIAWPINHVRVKCYKIQNYCQLDQIQLDVPDDKSWSQNYQIIIDNTEYYNVSRWGQGIIDAESRETVGGVEQYL